MSETTAEERTLRLLVIEEMTDRQKSILGYPFNFDFEASLIADLAQAEAQRDEVMKLLGEERHWSVAIRALDSWHEINLQDSRCDCPGHKRIETLRAILKDHEAFLLVVKDM